MRPALVLCVLCIGMVTPTHSVFPCRTQPVSVQIDPRDVVPNGTPTGRIMGIVQSRHDQKPLDYANVIILGNPRGAMARHGGRFDLEDLAPGGHDLKAAFVGYRPVTIRDVLVVENHTTVVRLCLEKDPNPLPPCLVVTSGTISASSVPDPPRPVRKPALTVLRHAAPAPQEVVTVPEATSANRCERPVDVPASKVDGLVNREHRVEVTIFENRWAPPARDVVVRRPAIPHIQPANALGATPRRSSDLAARSSAAEEALQTCACGSVRVLNLAAPRDTEFNVASRAPREGIPKRTALQGNTPNPFNPATTVRFDLAAPGLVTLRIYDVQGRLVRELLDQELEAGRHVSIWDGTSGSGQDMSSGIYFLRMTAGSFVSSRKLTLLR